MRLLATITFVLLFSVSLIGQTRKDSLQRAYNTAETPEKKSEAAYLFARYWLQRNQDDSAKAMIAEVEQIAKSTGDVQQTARFHFIRGIAFSEAGNDKEAEVCYNKAIGMLRGTPHQLLLADVLSALAMKQLGHGKYDDVIRNGREAVALIGTENPTHTVCEARLSIGSAFLQLGNKPEALENIQQALDVSRIIKSRHYEMEALIFMGSIYNEDKDQEKSLVYFQDAYKIAEDLKLESAQAALKIYIANYYYEKKDYKKSLELYDEAARLNKEQEAWENYAGALGNIGNIYFDLGDYNKAVNYHHQAIAIFEANEFPQGSVIAMTNLAEAKLKLLEYDSAEYYYLESQRIAETMNSLLDYIENYKGLADLYEATHDYEKAYANYKLYKQYSDSVFNESKTQKMTELEMNYKFRQQENEREVKEQARIKRQNLIYLAAGIGLVALLVIIIMVWRVSALRKKANTSLERSNREISNQKDIIEQKNKEITDSINYAERIQRALLGSETILKQHVPDHFIMNRPKDIVSGDFFWSVFTQEKLVVVTADCTGHGVPGAFMSMIGVNFLNYLVMQQHITDPGIVLNKLRDEIINALNPKGIEQEGRDGIDMVICVYDLKNMQLQYSAANNPLWQVRNGSMVVHPADKMPVGKYEAAHTLPFSTHTVPLQPGDVIYTFTDGYADQFGGGRGKKFKYKPLQEMLLANHTRPFTEQREILEKTFDSWKGNLEQVDDVLVAGIKIG
jgi:serine phosphatase RsbU (regulator of sigma subunit)